MWWEITNDNSHRCLGMIRTCGVTMPIIGVYLLDPGEVSKTDPMSSSDKEFLSDMEGVGYDRSMRPNGALNKKSNEYLWSVAPSCAVNGESVKSDPEILVNNCGILYAATPWDCTRTYNACVKITHPENPEIVLSIIAFTNITPYCRPNLISMITLVDSLRP
jgi:hypothetical protein